MLQPLPPGFPTPEPNDPEPIGRELGRASAMWMRGAFADAAKKVGEVARRAVDERAKDSTHVDAARVASLLRVSAALSTLVEEMTTRGVTDPASIAISLEIDSADLTSSELVAAQSMEIASTDVESVRVAPSVEPAAQAAPPRPAPPARSPRALATTMQQASRPTIPDAPPLVVAVETNIASARTIDLKRTLPEGIRDPRVPKPTPRPFPKVAPPVESDSAPPAVSEPFQDLDVPSSELDSAPTTNPVPLGAKYPPSEAQASAATTRRASEPDMTGESTDPDPAPEQKKPD